MEWAKKACALLGLDPAEDSANVSDHHEEEAARAVAEAEAAQLRAEQEAAEAEEARLAELTSSIEKRRKEKEVVLGLEPDPGPTTTTVSVRLPDGSRTQRRFVNSWKVGTLFDFVDTAPSVPALHYSLVSNFPRRVFTRDGDEELTLEEAGLHPQAVLFVQADG